MLLILSYFYPFGTACQPGPEDPGLDLGHRLASHWRRP
jgi:hypothetical protein